MLIAYKACHHASGSPETWQVIKPLTIGQIVREYDFGI